VKSKLSRRDFTARLLAAVASPPLTLAQNNREHIRFGVFSLFEPQQLLLQSAQPLLLHLDRNLILIRPEDPATSIRTAPGKRFEVIHNGTTHDSTTLSVTSISGEATTFTLAVPPPSLHGTISRQYAATLELQIHPTSHVLQPVITMDRESAVASIVLAESPAHAPLAYLQAQAIVSRSFLLAGVSGHSGFDFCDTTHCQLLREVPPPDSLVTRAALQTRSLHLTYDGQSFPAMYSRSCGGHTHTLADLGLPVGIYPYFSVVCDVCLHHPERWQRTIDSLLEPPHTERARLALDRIHGWSALPSGTFERTSAGIEGVGIGHGIGLCQLGAAALAAQGSEYHTLLAHFYPNTVVASPG
jgi:peptidoglycan hydrolase-like amidase